MNLRLLFDNIQEINACDYHYLQKLFKGKTWQQNMRDLATSEPVAMKVLKDKDAMRKERIAREKKAKEKKDQ